MMIKCPCCQSKIAKEVIYARDNCPTLNNVVYKTKSKGLNCAVGDIELVVCGKCNFVFNHGFNKELISYDGDYDNTRIFSDSYNRYLDDLISICSQNMKKEAKVLEIGCGKGDFLKKLCAVTGAKGFGFDSTYEGTEAKEQNPRFFKEYFKPLKSRNKFDVLILRHVLEHIPMPYDFLKNICDSGVLLPGAKLWVEIPDFEWILNKGTFYDITYEHCNYFFKQTFVNLLSLVGFDVSNVKNLFGGQYILLEAEYNRAKKMKKDKLSYPLAISGIIDRFSFNKKAYQDLILKKKNVCVWGASGKGVIFLSGLNKKVLKKIKYVIDINPKKQEKFLPVSAKRVRSPEVLKKSDDEFTILLMNEVYKSEVRSKLKEMDVEAQICTV